MEKETKFEMTFSALAFIAMIATIVAVICGSSYVTILGTWVIGYTFSLMVTISQHNREVRFKESLVDILDENFIEKNQ